MFLENFKELLNSLNDDPNIIDCENIKFKLLLKNIPELIKICDAARKVAHSSDVRYEDRKPFIEKLDEIIQEFEFKDLISK